MASRTGSRAPDGDRAEASRKRAFAAKRDRHRARAALSPVEKIAELLRLQKEILPILRSRRPLAPHERPWEIRP